MRSKEISGFLFLSSINRIDALEKDTNILKEKIGELQKEIIT